jgi:hypothetical protein
VGTSVASAVIRGTVYGTSDVFVSSRVEKIPVVAQSPVQGNLLYIHNRSCVRIMNLHISKDVIGDMCMRLAERLARGGKINACRNFTENPEWERSLERFRRPYNNIKMNLE